MKRSLFKVSLIILAVLMVLVIPLFTIGAYWLQNVGLLSSSAVVFASDAPAVDRMMANILKGSYGSRIGVCDNSDDQTEINAALAALTGGGVIHLSAGTFTCRQTGSTGYSILIPSVSGITIEGEGWGTTSSSATIVKIATGAECDLFYATWAGTLRTMLKFKDMFLMGDNAGTSGNGIHLVADGSNHPFQDVVIDNCRFGYFPTTACDLDNGWGLRFTNNVVEDNKAVGVVIQSGGSQAYWAYNFFANNGTYGLNVKNSWNNLVGNHFHGNGTIGLYIQSSANNSVVGNTFAGPNSANSTTYGVLYLSGSTSSNNVITGNVIDARKRTTTYYYNKYALHIAGGSDNVVSNNQLLNGSTANVYDAGTNTKWSNNKGWIGTGEIRTYSGTITSAADHHGAIISSLDNPFGQAVRIVKVSISLTTQAGAAATLDVGLSANNNDDPATKLFTALPLNPGTTYPYLYNSLSNGVGGTAQGTQTDDAYWNTGATTRYLNFFNPSGASDNAAVWTYTVTVMGN